MAPEAAAPAALNMNVPIAEPIEDRATPACVVGLTISEPSFAPRYEPMAEAIAPPFQAAGSTFVASKLAALPQRSVVEKPLSRFAPAT